MSNATPERASVARRAERPAAGLLLGTGATQSVAQSPPQAVAERGPESAALVHDDGMGMRKVSQPSAIGTLGAHVAQHLGLAAQAVRRAVGHTGRRRSTGRATAGSDVAVHDGGLDGHERGHPSALLPLGPRLSGTELRVASIGSKLSMLLACRQKNSTTLVERYIEFF